MNELLLSYFKCMWIKFVNWILFLHATYVAVTFRHSCFPVIAWRRVVLLFSTRNNCCEFFAFYGVIIQSVTQSFLKTPVCGASLSYSEKIPKSYAIFLNIMNFRKCNKSNIDLEWLNNTLGINTIECKKLATIVSGRKK